MAVAREATPGGAMGASTGGDLGETQEQGHVYAPRRFLIFREAPLGGLERPGTGGLHRMAAGRAVDLLRPEMQHRGKVTREQCNSIAPFRVPLYLGGIGRIGTTSMGPGQWLR
jgi:hypothetical protein